MHDEVNEIEPRIFKKFDTLRAALAYMLEKSTCIVDASDDTIVDTEPGVIQADVLAFIQGIPSVSGSAPASNADREDLHKAGTAGSASSTVAQSPIPSPDAEGSFGSLQTMLKANGPFGKVLSLPKVEDPICKPQPVEASNHSRTARVEDEDARNSSINFNNIFQSGARKVPRSRQPSPEKSRPPTASAPIVTPSRQGSPFKPSTSAPLSPSATATRSCMPSLARVLPMSLVSPHPALPTPPVHNATDPSRIYMRIRDNQGAVIESVAHPGPAQLEVPRLGQIIDWYLDVFGYSSEFVQLLANARMCSQDVDRFAARLAENISYTEAEWLWFQMDLTVDVEQPFRFRRFGM